MGFIQTLFFFLLLFAASAWWLLPSKEEILKAKAPLLKASKIPGKKVNFKALQELRKHWIALGHRNVPSPDCCCSYESKDQKWYIDPVNGDKVYCQLHK